MKNAIEEKKRGMTPEETAFIERFVADYCRPHAVVEAERLTAFAAARQMSFMARGGGDFALAAGPSAPVQPEIRAPEEEVTFSRSRARARRTRRRPGGRPSQCRPRRDPRRC